MLVSRRGAIHNVIATGASTVAAAQMAAAAENSGAVQGGVTFVDVRTFGAIGDGVADDTSAIQAAVDDCFGKAESPNSGRGAQLNKPLYFPQGTYKTKAPIVLTNVRGGHIFGAGRFATTVNNVAGTSVFRTNGFEYSRIEMMQLSAAGKNADVLDLDWTNGGGTALQSNTFADMFFDGGAIGVNIGKSNMGSENLFLNCFFGPCATAGIRTSNFNALQNTLVGGNIQSCPIGVWVRMGSCSVYNTGFRSVIPSTLWLIIQLTIRWWSRELDLKAPILYNSGMALRRTLWAVPISIARMEFLHILVVAKSQSTAAYHCVEL